MAHLLSDPTHRSDPTSYDADEAYTQVWLRRHGIYFSLVLNTGLRVNEALALRWENVDLTNRVIKVREAVKNRRVTAIELGPPKTEAGIRPVTISSELLELLRKHRINQLKEKLAMGGTYEDNDLVIASSKGGYVNSSSIRCLHSFD